MAVAAATAGSLVLAPTGIETLAHWDTCDQLTADAWSGKTGDLSSWPLTGWVRTSWNRPAPGEVTWTVTLFHQAPGFLASTRRDGVAPESLRVMPAVAPEVPMTRWTKAS